MMVIVSKFRAKVRRIKMDRKAGIDRFAILVGEALGENDFRRK